MVEKPPHETLSAKDREAGVTMTIPNRRHHLSSVSDVTASTQLIALDMAVHICGPTSGLVQRKVAEGQG